MILVSGYFNHEKNSLADEFTQSRLCYKTKLACTGALNCCLSLVKTAWLSEHFKITSGVEQSVPACCSLVPVAEEDSEVKALQDFSENVVVESIMKISLANFG